MTPYLYIHIPFCVRKCAYCDFESHAGRLRDADVYIDRVLGEARSRRAEYGIDGVKSIYLGGGTPSLLSAGQLKRLMRGIQDLFPTDPDAECTLEANPGTLVPGFLESARAAGFNRLSLGVQAKQDRLLQMLGRIHRFDDAVKAADMARAAGFDNISCDVMNELPGQSPEDILETLAAVITLGAKHISCYGLILEEGTPLEARVRAGELHLPDEEQAREMQLTAVKRLEEAGYRRYEISNYAKPGYESRHNVAYWTGEDYLGLGCAAHSFLNGWRFSNPELDAYLNGADGIDAYPVDAQGRMEEAILLGTRRTQGVDLNAFKAAYGEKSYAKLAAAAKRMAGLVKLENDCLSLTDEGFLVHSAITAELVCAVEGQ